MYPFEIPFHRPLTIWAMQSPTQLVELGNTVFAINDLSPLVIMVRTEVPQPFVEQGSVHSLKRLNPKATFQHRSANRVPT